VVVELGLTVTGVPLITEMLPGVIMPVPFVKTAVRLELAPDAIVEGFAVKLTIVAPVEVPLPFACRIRSIFETIGGQFVGTFSLTNCTVLLPWTKSPMGTGRISPSEP
jgi:hypothetical protein